MQNQIVPKIENNIVVPAGRIGRAAYLSVMFPTNIIIFYLDKTVLSNSTNTYTEANAFLVAGVLFLCWVQIATIIKRLRDIKWTPWLAILILIPYIQYIISISCLFIKGKWDKTKQEEQLQD